MASNNEAFLEVDMSKQRAMERAIAATLKRHGTTVGAAAESCYKRFYLFYLGV